MDIPQIYRIYLRRFQAYEVKMNILTSGHPREHIVAFAEMVPQRGAHMGDQKEDKRHRAPHMDRAQDRLQRLIAGHKRVGHFKQAKDLVLDPEKVLQR